MPRWAERQDAISAALRDSARPPPHGLVGPDGEPSAKRFAVYRNNVAVALVEALEANFPVVGRLVGEEFFHAMARAYSFAEPPASPLLFAYGEGFPDFVQGFAPAAALPYLADVARLERAWREAYHAREANPAAPEALAAIPAERIPLTRFAPHPSLRLIRSGYPVVTIWRMNVADGVPGPVDLDDNGEDALVTRPRAEVEIRILPPGGAEFVTALAESLPLQDAAKIALRTDPAFDLSCNIRCLIEAGALAGVRREEEFFSGPKRE